MSKRILIAYYSHRGENLVDGEIKELPIGNTEKTASSLYDILKNKGYTVELFEIEPVIPYPLGYDDLVEKAREEKESGLLPRIEEGPKAFEFYDVVFLGYPLWWTSYPQTVASFLKGHDFTGKAIIPFVTHGGQIFSGSLDDLRAAAPNAKILEGFAVVDAYINQGPYVIENYLKDHEDYLK